MQWITLGAGEFSEFRDVQIRPRADWPATFSCNEKREVWPFNTYGYTHEEKREYLQGDIPMLDRIVDMFLAEHPAGGRFHIDGQGVALADTKRYIARFRICP